MFARWISCEEKTATGEIALMSRDSGFRAVNRVVAPNRAIRDKEKSFMYSHIWICLLKGKKF